MLQFPQQYNDVSWELLKSNKTDDHLLIVIYEFTKMVPIYMFSLRCIKENQESKSMFLKYVSTEKIPK